MIIKLFWLIHVDNFHVGYYSLFHFPLCWRYQNISQHQYHRWLNVYAENLDQHAHVDSAQQYPVHAFKCKALTITRKKSPLDFIYKLDNLELERVSTEKVVVVNITNSLTWNTHIHSITAKAYKLLGFLKHTCPLLNDFSAKHILSLYLVNCTILPLPSLVWRLLVDHVLIIICTMGGASHGSSRPVRTFPFDLITLNHFAHIFHFFFLAV